MKKAFDDHRLGVFCCGHVFRMERAILLVCRDDGDWQFLCGQTDHGDSNEPYVVCVGELLKRDASLNEVASVERDWEAERARPGGQWIRTRISPSN